MDSFSLGESELSNSIKQSLYVVIDCNISAVLLNRIQITCQEFGKKLIAACVSEVKAHRILQIERRPGVPYPFFAVSLNSAEAAALGCLIDEGSTAAARINACKLVGAENLIITQGPEGFIAIDCTGSLVKFDAPIVPNIASLTGGGDALIAAFCIYYAQHKSIVWTEVNRAIQRLVTAVLQVRGGTVGSETRPNELRVVPREELERIKSLGMEHFIRAFGEPVVLFGKRIPFGDVITVISVIIAIMALFFEIAGN